MTTTPTLSGRIAIVTGASAGIGLAVAEQLVQAGARVVINARRRERLDELAGRLNQKLRDPAVTAVAGDAADQRVIDEMLNAAHNHFGGEADLVVVNAGRGLRGSVLDSDASQWEEILRTNVLAAALLMRAAGKRMLDALNKDAATGGKWTEHARDIVLIGSVVGRNVSPFSSAYGATKFAVHGLAEGLRRELAPKGIRVSLVAPGFVVSEFQGVAGYDPKWFEGVLEKLGPALEPADVARLIGFIASQPAHVHVGDVLIRPTRQDYP